MFVESYRESPRKFDLRTPHRKTLNRWIGRTPARRPEVKGAVTLKLTPHQEFDCLVPFS